MIRSGFVAAICLITFIGCGPESMPPEQLGTSLQGTMLRLVPFDDRVDPSKPRYSPVWLKVEGLAPHERVTASVQIGCCASGYLPGDYGPDDVIVVAPPVESYSSPTIVDVKVERRNPDRTRDHSSIQLLFDTTRPLLRSALPTRLGRFGVFDLRFNEAITANRTEIVANGGMYNYTDPKVPYRVVGSHDLRFVPKDVPPPGKRLAFDLSDVWITDRAGLTPNFDQRQFAAVVRACESGFRGWTASDCELAQLLGTPKAERRLVVAADDTGVRWLANSETRELFVSQSGESWRFHSVLPVAPYALSASDGRAWITEEDAIWLSSAADSSWQMLPPPCRGTSCESGVTVAGGVMHGFRLEGRTLQMLRWSEGWRQIGADIAPHRDEATFESGTRLYPLHDGSVILQWSDSYPAEQHEYWTSSIWTPQAARFAGDVREDIPALNPYTARYFVGAAGELWGVDGKNIKRLERGAWTGVRPPADSGQLVAAHVVDGRLTIATAQPVATGTRVSFERLEDDGRWSLAADTVTVPVTGVHELSRVLISSTGHADLVVASLGELLLWRAAVR